MNNPTYHLKELEKEETKPRISRRKEINMSGNKQNRDQQVIEKINEPRAVFVKGYTNSTGRWLGSPKRKERKPKEIRYERRKITDTIEIQKAIR